jgi:hypothetical protein
VEFIAKVLIKVTRVTLTLGVTGLTQKQKKRIWKRLIYQALKIGGLRYEDFAQISKVGK